MVSKALMYACFAGLGILGPLCTVLWLREKDIDPLGKAMRGFRRLPWPARLIVTLHLGIWIAYGSVKAPTNGPMLGAAAPRRSGVVRPSGPWRVGTNETWNLDCPVWATEVAPWGRRGAFDEWISCGPLGVLVASGRVIAGGEAHDVYPEALSVVPAARLSGTNAAPRVWYGRAPWGSDVYTWQDACPGRETNAFVSVQLELLPNGDRICRYDDRSGVTSRAYLAPRPPGSDSDGDGVPDANDPDVMDPDADGDGLADGMPLHAYEGHALWRANSPDGEPMDIRLNEPVVPPAKAVLQVGTLRILLTTNAVYRLSLQEGVRYDVKLTTNGFQPVNLTAERGED